MKYAPISAEKGDKRYRTCETHFLTNTFKRKGFY